MGDGYYSEVKKMEEQIKQFKAENKRLLEETKLGIEFCCTKYKIKLKAKNKQLRSLLMDIFTLAPNINNKKWIELHDKYISIKESE